MAWKKKQASNGPTQHRVVVNVTTTFPNATWDLWDITPKQVGEKIRDNLADLPTREELALDIKKAFETSTAKLTDDEVKALNRLFAHHRGEHICHVCLLRHENADHADQVIDLVQVLNREVHLSLEQLEAVTDRLRGIVHEFSSCRDEHGCNRDSSSDAGAGAPAAAHGMRSDRQLTSVPSWRSRVSVRVAAALRSAATHLEKAGE